MEVIIHFLIADHWQYLEVLKVCILVLFKDGLAVLVQLNNKTICSLDSRDFYVISLDIALASYRIFKIYLVNKI